MAAQSSFKHPLKNLIEGHLADIGVIASEVVKAEENQATYSFRSPKGTTAVLRLYWHQDEGDIPRAWICFEFGVGYTLCDQAPSMLHAIAIDMYTCFVPIRACCMPDSEDAEILILICRAQADTFTSSYLPRLIDLAVAIADNIRESKELGRIA